MTRWIALFLALNGPVAAETLVAAHTIRAKTVLSASDIAMVQGQTIGGLSNPEAVLGLEARVTLYAGRPIRAGDIGPPAVIERNQLVTLRYANDVVSIQADGRALERAGAGDRVRAMNLNSRNTIVGTATADGRILVEGGIR